MAFDKGDRVRITGDTRNYQHSETGSIGTIRVVDHEDDTALVDVPEPSEEAWGAWVGLEDLELA